MELLELDSAELQFAVASGCFESYGRGLVSADFTFFHVEHYLSTASHDDATLLELDLPMWRAKRLGLEEAANLLSRWSDSFSRMRLLCDLHSSMECKDWLALLGENWNRTDHPWVKEFRMRELLDTAQTIPELMTVEEHDILRALSDVITIFRGCGISNRDGSAWSSDPISASLHPRMSRYLSRDPILLTATVKRDEILALKQYDEGLEFLTFSAEVKSQIPAMHLASVVQ